MPRQYSQKNRKIDIYEWSAQWRQWVYKGSTNWCKNLREAAEMVRDEINKTPVAGAYQVCYFDSNYFKDVAKLLK